MHSTSSCYCSFCNCSRQGNSEAALSTEYTLTLDTVNNLEVPYEALNRRHTLTLDAVNSKEAFGIEHTSPPGYEGALSIEYTSTLYTVNNDEALGMEHIRKCRNSSTARNLLKVMDRWFANGRSKGHECNVGKTN